MSLLQQVVKNTALQWGGKMIGTGAGFIVAIILNRYLRAELMGSYTTAMTYLQLFGIVMDLGLYVVLLKHINSPENKEGKLQNNIFTFRTASAVILLSLAISTVWFIPQYPLIVKWAVLVLAVNYFCITMNQLFQAVFQKHLAMHWVAIAEVMSKVTLLVSTLSVVYLVEQNLLAIMATIVLSGFVQTAILYLASRRYEHLQVAFDWAVWKRVIQESWPIAIAIALNLIYFKSDTIILSFYYPQSTVGIYGVPYKMLEVLITLPAMIVGLLMPVLSQRFEQHDLTGFNQLYQRALQLLWMLVAPIVVGGTILAQPLMLFIAGEDFTSTPEDFGPLFSILLLATASIFLGTLTGYVVVIINKHRIIILGYAFVAVTALTAYLLLIPRFSYYGAAWVTVYSEFTMFCIASLVIYRTTKALPGWSGLLRVTSAAAIMGIGVLWMQHWPLVISIALGGLLYSGALLVVGGIKPNDLKTLLRKQTV